MTVYVQEAFDSAGWNPTITGVGAGNAVFLVATGTNGGTPSVSSITLGGVAADGQRLVLVGADLVFFAWWHSLTAGDKTMSATTTNIGLTDCVLIEFSGWTGSATAVEDESSGADPSAGLNHDGGSVTLAGPGIVLAGGRWDNASGTTAWAELTSTGGGSREIQGYAIVGGADTVSAAWTSQSAITANTAVVAIAEGGGAAVAELSGSGSLALTASGNLTGDAALSGSAALGLSASGDLAAVSDLSGSAALGLAASGDLTGSAALRGAGSFALAASGDLVGDAALSGSATLALAASGNLQIDNSADLSGTASLSLAASGSLAGDAALSGSAAFSLTARGNLQGGDDLERGGHFGGMVGIPAGRKRREEIEAVVEAAIEEIVDAPRIEARKKPVTRVSRADRSRIIAAASRALVDAQAASLELEALERQIEALLERRLAERREQVRSGELARAYQARLASIEAERADIEAREEEDVIAVVLLLM